MSFVSDLLFPDNPTRRAAVNQLLAIIEVVSADFKRRTNELTEKLATNHSLAKALAKKKYDIQVDISEPKIAKPEDITEDTVFKIYTSEIKSVLSHYAGEKIGQIAFDKALGKAQQQLLQNGLIGPAAFLRQTTNKFQYIKFGAGVSGFVITETALAAIFGKIEKNQLEDALAELQKLKESLNGYYQRLLDTIKEIDKATLSLIENFVSA